MLRLTARPTSAAPDTKAMPLTCVKKRGRDPNKYSWMPPDPPRVPRPTLTVVQAAMALIVLWAVLGVLAFAALEWRMLVKLAGLLIWVPQG